MRIWFNHWFSTVYHLINLIKDGDPGKFTIIGSNENTLSVYKNACDEWYQEPYGIPSEQYIEFCLDFCQKHNIDIFVPRKEIVAISHAHKQFETIGVKLLDDADYDMISLLEDKAATYKFFEKYVSECIPTVKIAHSMSEFLQFYFELLKSVPRVCYKLVEDEGARSFRVIDERIETSDALLEKPGAKITLNAAIKVLSGYDFSIPVLLMPYLSGVEVSVDCLKTPNGNMIIPRYKTNKRYSEIIFKESLMNTCSCMMDAMGLEMPLNIQFKVESGKYYLLEVNPRMSGGLQLSCEATGINLPSIAVNKLLGITKKWEYPQNKTRKVVHIETPICLD